MIPAGALENSIRGGLRFMQASQSEAGYWSDWQLPPGASRMWTTAYVGYRLSRVPKPLWDLAQCVLRGAATWLASAEFDDGGWGYNEEVGPDADSTSLAILFLSSHGVRVPERSYERLREFQREDGGFSTYTYEQSFGAWVTSHPDVSALAIPALLTRYEPTEHFLLSASRYAIAQVRPDGLWNSYWWITSLYATEANLRWLVYSKYSFSTTTTRRTLLQMQPQNVFETALLVLSLLQIGCRLEPRTISGWTDALINAQLPDGSWPSEPILRMPPRDWYQPWAVPEPAPAFPDPHRIFTSATVVAALSAACRVVFDLA
jgi:hypothetical protein